MGRVNSKYLLIFIYLFFFRQQTTLAASFPISQWVQLLDVKEDSIDNHNYWTITLILRTYDSATIINTLGDLEKKGTSAGPRFRVRFILVKAQVYYVNYRKGNEALIEQWFRSALYKAYEIEDWQLAALASRQLGELMYQAGRLEPAAMYGLNAVELLQKSGKRIHWNESYTFWMLGEIFYHTHDYKKCIDYTLQSFRYGLDTVYPDGVGRMMGWNTIGMAWYKLGNYDEAMVAFEKSIALAGKLNNEIWMGIGAGNKGKIYFQQRRYREAQPLLEADYRISRQDTIWDNAANALQWTARINQLEGKRSLALQQLREALGLLKRKPHPEYLINTYYALWDYWRSQENRDSAAFYFGQYTRLRDSMERVVALSQSEIVRIKLDHERNLFEIRTLQKQKKLEELKRNTWIAGICLLAIIVLLYLNQQQLKLRHKEQLALQQKAAAETEVAAAKEQLQLFTRNIREKAALIEKLQQQVQDKQLTGEQQLLLDQLARTTILTEEDWTRFKFLFEKIYPGFFIKLKEMAPFMTQAEQRMAALTRLHLPVREIASMLGISSHSVHKTRQRLRYRLHLPDEKSLEGLVAGL